MTDQPAIERPSDHPLVRVEVLDGPVAVLRLSDTPRRNALRIELALDLEAAVADALDAGCGALVLTAEPPVFCSGGDLDDLVAPRATLSDIGRGANALRSCPVPTIAVVEGPVIGAGINLVLACDLILCSPEAVFDPRMLDLGVHPGGGQLRDLARRVGRQGAVALSLLGDRLTGTEAVAAGLAWRCLPSAELHEAALRFASRAASRPRPVMLRAMETLDRTIDSDHATAAAVELEVQQWSMEQPWIIERVTELRERLKKPAAG